MINILTCVFILIWFFMAMMSPMAFDAPGSELHSVFDWPWTLILILFCTPLLAIIMYHQFEWSLFSWPNVVPYSIFSLQALLVAGFYGASFLQAANARAIDGLDREYFARVKDKVYFQGSLIVDADANTFRQIQKPYFQDDKHIFTFDREKYGAIGVVTTEVDNFKAYPEPYQFFSTDGKNVFYGATKLADMDPASVEFYKNNELVTIKSKTATYQQKEGRMERIVP